MPKVRFQIYGRSFGVRRGGSNLGHHAFVALKECEPVKEVPLKTAQTVCLGLLGDCMGIRQPIQSHIALRQSGVREILARIEAVSLAEFLGRLLPSPKRAVFKSKDA